MMTISIQFAYRTEVSVIYYRRRIKFKANQIRLVKSSYVYAAKMFEHVHMQHFARWWVEKDINFLFLFSTVPFPKSYNKCSSHYPSVKLCVTLTSTDIFKLRKIGEQKEKQLSPLFHIQYKRQQPCHFFSFDVSNRTWVVTNGHFQKQYAYAWYISQCLTNTLTYN